MDATKQAADVSEDNAFLWQKMDDLGAVFRECLNCLDDHMAGLPGLYQLNPEQRRLFEAAAIDTYWRCVRLTSMTERDAIRRALTEAVSIVLSWQGDPEKTLTASEAQEASDKIRAVGSLFDDLILRYHQSRREHENISRTDNQGNRVDYDEADPAFYPNKDALADARRAGQEHEVGELETLTDQKLKKLLRKRECSIRYMSTKRPQPRGRVHREDWARHIRLLVALKDQAQEEAAKILRNLR